MLESEYDIIILKPTSVFSYFLKTQLPPNIRVNNRLLQCDNTAYIIKKQKNDEALIDEIERNFGTMFEHEIQRWLGKDAYNVVQSSFLDFLFCFKFELHSQIVLMENDICAGKKLLRLRPKEEMLGWMKSAVQADEELTHILERSTIQRLSENSTVVVKNFNELDSIKPFLKEYYPTIVESEMFRMCDDKESWPEINSYQDFCRYFTVDIHTQVIPLH